MNYKKIFWAALLTEKSIFNLSYLGQAHERGPEPTESISRINDFLHELSPAKKATEELRAQILEGIHLDFKKNRRLLTADEIEFPHTLRYLEEPPLLLRIEGSCPWMDHVGLAVVGSREPRDYSIRWLQSELKDFLRENSCFVSSGGARGVDQRAHLLAVQLGIPTVVFLPSGLDKIYPDTLRSFRNLIIESGGCLISEYKSEDSMRKHHFAQRNRLISGISLATLVIEAKFRSGTLLTARECIDQHKPLWVLPGHPLDSALAGNNSLLMEGATPVLSAQDLGLLFRAEQLQFESSVIQNVPI